MAHCYLAIPKLSCSTSRESIYLGFLLRKLPGLLYYTEPLKMTLMSIIFMKIAKMSPTLWSFAELSTERLLEVITLTHGKKATSKSIMRIILKRLLSSH